MDEHEQQQQQKSKTSTQSPYTDLISFSYKKMKTLFTLAALKYKMF